MTELRVSQCVKQTFYYVTYEVQSRCERVTPTCLIDMGHLFDRHFCLLINTFFYFVSFIEEEDLQKNRSKLKLNFVDKYSNC